MKFFLSTLLFIVKRVVLILFSFYVVLLVVLFFFQESLIFFPQPASVMTPGSPIERIDYDISRVHLSGFIRKGDGPTYFYFGGNASEAYRSFAALSMSGTIISFNYRSYGESTGKPSEANLFSDAVALNDLLEKDGHLKQEETILFGRSLGSGVAAYLSSKRPSKAIILVTPFDSLLALGKELYPIVPVEWLLRHHFLSVDYLQGYTHPILVIYGGKDLAIPNGRTKNLIANLQKSTMTHFIEGATHDDIHLYREFTSSIEEFLAPIIAPTP